MNDSIYIELYEQENSIKTLKDESPAVFWGFGATFLLCGILNFIAGIRTESLWQLLIGAGFLLSIWDLYNYAQGKGTLQSRLFPRFISIDKEGISVKQNGFKKPNFTSWESINSIQAKMNAFIVNPGGKEPYEVSLEKVSYRELRKVKALIVRLAQDQGILFQK